jgi:hypothetical protein
MRRKYSGRREQAVVDFRGQGRYKVDPQSGPVPALSIVPPHLFPYTQFRRRSLVSFFSSISGNVPRLRTELPGHDLQKQVVAHGSTLCIAKSIGSNPPSPPLAKGVGGIFKSTCLNILPLTK